MFCPLPTVQPKKRRLAKLSTRNKSFCTERSTWSSLENPPTTQDFSLNAEQAGCCLYKANITLLLPDLIRTWSELIGTRNRSKITCLWKRRAGLPFQSGKGSCVSVGFQTVFYGAGNLTLSVALVFGCVRIYWKRLKTELLLLRQVKAIGNHGMKDGKHVSGNW